ncbi:MAG TPA: RodZ domain-containing protein [Vicinamibacterales bacterium]
MDVGATLQSARESRGLSLDELSDRTKISVRLLRALERNAVDVLPRGIFMRGYLRAYATEVGLDPAETVESYLAQFEPLEPVTPSTDEHREDDVPAEELVVLNRYGSFDPSADSGSEAGKAIAIALVSLGFVAYLSLGTAREPVASEPTLPADIASAVDRRDGAAVLPAGDVSVPVATSGNALEIAIHPAGPCWVEAIVDGDRRLYRLMSAGDREAITVHEDLTLRVGDPSAFRFSINGRAGRVTGRAGQPITIRIDPENFSDFLPG